MVTSLKVITEDVTTQLLRDWETVRERIATGEVRAIALIEVNKNRAVATMFGVPEKVPYATINSMLAGCAVLERRLVDLALEECV